MSLHVRALTFTKGERCLFSDLTFTVPPGGALRVLGANGAGKTSLLRVLCGLTRPDAGEITWQGINVDESRAEYQASLVYAGHADALKGDLLAWENVAFGARLNGPDTKARALQSLASMGLSEQAGLPARALSQGQRKRVGLARLLLAPARSLWILDEPFSYLDNTATAALSSLLEAHCESGGMLVYTTHQQDALHRAATLELGRGREVPC